MKKMLLPVVVSIVTLGVAAVVLALPDSTPQPSKPPSTSAFRPKSRLAAVCH